MRAVLGAGVVSTLYFSTRPLSCFDVFSHFMFAAPFLCGDQEDNLSCSARPCSIAPLEVTCVGRRLAAQPGCSCAVSCGLWGIRGRPPVCILARGTALLHRLEVSPPPPPGPPESPAIPPSCAGGGLSLCPGRPPTFPARRPRGPRSCSLREPFGPCAAPVARLLQQVVLVLRGRSVTRGPLLGVRVRRDPQQRSPARRCGRQACRSALPAAPRARRPAAGPLLRAPLAPRPTPGAARERRGEESGRAAARPGLDAASRLQLAHPALFFPGTWRTSFWSTRNGSCVRFGKVRGRHTALLQTARGRQRSYC